MCDEFDLMVLDSASQSRAVAVARYGADIAIQPLCCSQLRTLLNFRHEIESAILGQRDRPSPQDLKVYGCQLFNFLFVGEIKRLYDRLPTKHIRLHVLSDHSDIQSLPWELIQENQWPCGPNINRTVVRLVPTIGFTKADLPASARLNILHISADPPEWAPVDWQECEEIIKRTFENVLSSELPNGQKLDYSFHTIEGVSRKSLLKSLQHLSFDVLHFSGHGQVKNGMGSLLLQRSQSRAAEECTAQELCQILQGRHLRLVVLSCCESASGNFSLPFSVIAKELVLGGIPAVVASQFPLPNATVASFVGTMYQCLASPSQPEFLGDIDRASRRGTADSGQCVTSRKSCGARMGYPSALSPNRRTEGDFMSQSRRFTIVHRSRSKQSSGTLARHDTQYHAGAGFGAWHQAQ